MMSLVRAQLGEPKEYSLSTVGVDDAGGPPVPIPNTEVKPCSAENSALAMGCENSKMQTLDSEYFFIQKWSAIAVCTHWCGLANAAFYFDA